VSDRFCCVVSLAPSIESDLLLACETTNCSLDSRFIRMPSLPSMLVVAITGGAGFVGRRLAASLLDDQGLSIREVRLLDVRSPDPIPFAPSTRRQRYDVGRDRLKYIKCDLTNATSVDAALTGVDTVFHLASYGMSGREMLDTERIRAVNLDGTRHIIDACSKQGIPRLLYVSTYNVVFGTQVILNGKEDEVPYYPLESFHDEYSKTKRIAEEWVLQANSTGQ
jgi:nucleoside-diphosphate-sugar epimerase